MRADLTAKDRGFLRAIGAADADEEADPTTAVVNAHLDRLESAYAAATARAEYWKQRAFMWCSGAVVLAAFLLLWGVFLAAAQ